MRKFEQEDVKEVERYYDKRAIEKDEIKAAGQWGPKEHVPEIIQEIIKKIKIRKEDKILEIGCGSGVLGKSLKDLCNLYVGLDISNFMLRKFQSINKEKKINLFQAVTYDLPLKKNFFDIVIMNSVTMYLGDKILKKTLYEMLRVSKQNSILFIGDNVTPENANCELLWFQNLSKNKQKISKPYIKFRKWFAKKIPKYAGKWRKLHYEVSPDFIGNFFKDKGEMAISHAATFSIKQKYMGNDYKGSRRMDFVIKLDLKNVEK